MTTVPWQPGEVALPGRQGVAAAWHFLPFRPKSSCTATAAVADLERPASAAAARTPGERPVLLAAYESQDLVSRVICGGVSGC